MMSYQIATITYFVGQPVLGPTFYIGLEPTLIDIGPGPTFLYRTRANVSEFFEIFKYIGLGPTLKMRISD